MRLPLKKSMLNTYLFRGTVRGPHGYALSEGDKRITGDSMHNSLVRIGKILGWESNATAYTLRYAAGNNMNQNVDISQELQNSIMGHAPNSDTFQKNYLNRNITYSRPLGSPARVEPQRDVMRDVTSFGHHRSSRRPIGLSTGEVEALKLDPEYKYYEERLSKLPRGTPQYKQGQRDLIAASKRLRYAATKKAMGREWTEKQAMEDITMQLTGQTPPSIPHLRKGQRPPRSRGVLQQAILDALNQPMQTTLEKQLLRRTAAIEALTAYMSVQEPLVTRFVEKAKPHTPNLPAPNEETREAEAARMRQSVAVQSENQKLLRCYFCVGQALTLPPLDLNIAKLCHAYSTPSAMRRHFDKAHLAFMQNNTRLDSCPICIPKSPSRT